MTLARICCYCGLAIERGDPGAPITHGICPVCLRRELATIAEMDRQVQACAVAPGAPELGARRSAAQE